jgi:hypothetical protein
LKEIVLSRPAGEADDADRLARLFGVTVLMVAVRRRSGEAGEVDLAGVIAAVNRADQQFTPFTSTPPRRENASTVDSDDR